MKKTAIFVFIQLMFQLNTFANIYPVNGSVLNFTQVMFEFNEQSGADTYVLTVISSDDNKKISVSKKSLACLVTAGLKFGKSYYWFYTALKKGKPIFKSEQFQFSIENSLLTDTLKYRYKILKKLDGLYENDLLFIDHLGAAINRNGEVVWYLPGDSVGTQTIPYRNMNFTTNGTVTYLKNSACEEKDIHGNIIWKAPNDGAVSGDEHEYYHHDFLKLEDGTYMTSSYKFENTPNYFDPNIISRVRYNTLIQYNASGEVIWSWNEKDHVSAADIFKQATATDTDVPGTHLNGFDYDKKSNTLILSYRNNSTLMLIDKTTGNVINLIKGEGRKKGEKESEQTIRFLKQHGPSFKKDGTILFYNNNVQKDETVAAFPIIMNIQLPRDGGKPELLWQYECRLQDHPEGWMSKEGYVKTLKNDNLLVCVGGNNKIFEVSPQKNVVWEMNCEMFNKNENKWTDFNNYRCNAISSLYPHYFTIQNLNNKNKLLSNESIRIKLNNDGTNQSDYKIEMISENKTIAGPYLVTVAAQSSLTKTLHLPVSGIKKDKHKSEVSIKISPVNNPVASKKITYEITQ